MRVLYITSGRLSSTIEGVKKMRESLQKKAFDYIKSENIDAKSCAIFEDHGDFTVKMCGDDEEKTLKCGDIMPFKGYLSTFGNVDRDGDVVMQSAFDESLQSQKVYPLQKNHYYSTESQMGDFTCKVDAKGLMIEGEIVCTEANMHECMMIKAGKLTTLSMGGMFRYSEQTNKNGNSMIERVILFEGSIVSIPANPQARFTLKMLEKTEQVAEAKAEPVPETVAQKIDRINKLLRS